MPTIPEADVLNMLEEQRQNIERQQVEVAKNIEAAKQATQTRVKMPGTFNIWEEIEFERKQFHSLVMPNPGKPGHVYSGLTPEGYVKERREMPTGAFFKRLYKYERRPRQVLFPSKEDVRRIEEITGWKRGLDWFVGRMLGLGSKPKDP